MCLETVLLLYASRRSLTGEQSQVDNQYSKVCI